MPSTRHRKPYALRSDSDVSEDEVLDEQQQEELIESLSSEDAKKTTYYRIIFVALPLIASFPFVVVLLSISSLSPWSEGMFIGARGRLVAMLCTSSLWCTAYILWFIPARPKPRNTNVRLSSADGPLEQYLPTMNGSLVAVLWIWAAVQTLRGGSYDDFWRLSLPAHIFGITMLVRQYLAPLDIEGLQNARYVYKGA